jgi:hypothetical protein
MVYVIQVCRQLPNRIRMELYRVVDGFRAGSGWNCSSILILLLESCQQTFMKYTIAECTVNNS